MSSGSEFQTVGPATKKHNFQTCCSEHVEQTVDDAWQSLPGRCWWI